MKKKFLYLTIFLFLFFLIIGENSRNKNNNDLKYSINKIPHTSGSITVTSPISSDSWMMGMVNTIQWQKTDVDAVKIELYKGGSFDRSIFSYWTGTSLSWTVPTDLVEGSNYRIKVTDFSDSLTYDFSDYFTIIEAEAKSITITNPTSSTSVKIDSSLGISWTSTGDIDTVKIELYKGGSQHKSIFPTAINDGYFSWTVSNDLTVGTNYQIKITDTSDATVNDLSDYFTITDSSETTDDDDTNYNDNNSNDTILGYDFIILFIAISLSSIFIVKKLEIREMIVRKG